CSRFLFGVTLSVSPLSIPVLPLEGHSCLSLAVTCSVRELPFPHPPWLLVRWSNRLGRCWGHTRDQARRKLFLRSLPENAISWILDGSFDLDMAVIRLGIWVSAADRVISPSQANSSLPPRNSTSLGGEP